MKRYKPIKKLHSYICPLCLQGVTKGRYYCIHCMAPLDWSEADDQRDYPYHVNAHEIIKGGTGYCISVQDGKEVFDVEKHINLPDEIEHMYPDYSLYPELTKDTAYGFLTR